MKVQDFQNMLLKVEEVKALFTIAQRVVPYLQEIVLFVQETTPILGEMNASLLQTSSQMPMAVKKLDKVSESTEMATTQILNHVDVLLSRSDEALNITSEIREAQQSQAARAKEMILAIATCLDGAEETSKANVAEALDDLFAESIVEKKLDRLQELIQTVQGNTYEIMNRMQIQDITTQQLMAANSMIESVQERLSELMARFGNLEVEQVEKKERFFDPNAVYESRESTQAMVDEIMQTQNALTDKPKTPAETEAVKEVNAADLSQLKNEPPLEAPLNPSQDDIDKIVEAFKK